ANQGTAVVHWTVTLNGAFTNAAGATLLIQSNPTFLGTTLIGPSAGFTNAGTIRMESSISIGTLVRIPGGALTNTATGHIEANHGSHVIVGNVTNEGTVAVNRQRLEIFSSVFTQNGGTVRATGAESQFLVERGAFQFNGGTLKGDVVAHNAAVSVAATVTAPSTLRAVGRCTFLGNLSPQVTVWAQGRGFPFD